MKYPMYSIVDLSVNYPYQFRFDLVDSQPYHLPKDQIPHLKGMVNRWLAEHEIDYMYRSGLVWLLKNEQDAIIFQLRWA